MKRFIAGADRSHSTLLPECLDDWVDESNPVRGVDAFVDTLDLGELGFADVEPATRTPKGKLLSVTLQREAGEMASLGADGGKGHLGHPGPAPVQTYRVQSR